MTWGSPRGSTRDRIESFLDDTDLDPHYRRLLVFHCGLTSRAPEY